MLEFVVFMRVKMDNLNALSISMPDIVNKEDNINKEIINIINEIKYLLISLVSNFEFENSNLFINTLSGFACETSSFIENLNREKSLTNRIPELVEKKDPPIIVIIKNKKVIFWYELFVDKPILDILLHKDKNISLKL